MTRATVLLLSADEAPLLAYSLPAAVVQEDCDVYVVDNGSSDHTGDLATMHRADFLRVPEQTSYAAAMNMAIRRTEGEAVLLLRAGCVLAPDYLERARVRLDEHRVGSVAGKLLRDGAGDEIDAAGITVDRRRRPQPVGHGLPARRFARAGQVFGADGACALYRRETLEQCALGGEVFDEELGAPMAAAADLAWRARLLGWRCVYEPSAVARHNAQDSAAEPAFSRERYLMWVKNETRRGLLHDLPGLAAQELATLGRVLAHERNSLGGYRRLARELPQALGRRAEVQARTAVARAPFGLSPPP